MIDNQKNYTYSVPCKDVARVVEFSPYELSSKLLAIGTSTQIIIASCRFPEEDPELEDIEYEELQIFQPGCSITALSWSPETSASVISSTIKFAAAGMDHNLRIVNLNLQGDPDVEILKGHKSFINAVAYEPNLGQQIASVGDDNTCRVWEKDKDSSETKEAMCFYLMSPGVSVCWHHEEPKKILVAQKNGILRFFSLHNQQPIMSLDCGQSPLMSADWCHMNSLAITAGASTDWLLFDSSVSSAPADKKQAHTEGVQQIRWCRCSDNLLATIGHPGCQLKVFSVKQQQITKDFIGTLFRREGEPVYIDTNSGAARLLMSQSYPVGSGLSWHLRLPILVVAGDQCLYFWSASMY